MPTVHSEFGLRFAIYANDHEPAHVHVLGDGKLKIAIRGDGGFPQMIYAVGMKATDRRRAMDVMLQNQEAFLASWNKIQGALE